MQTDYSNGEPVSDGLGIGREVSGGTIKEGHWETCMGDGSVYLLILALISCMYTYIKSQPVVYFKYMRCILCKL